LVKIISALQFSTIFASKLLMYHLIFKTMKITKMLISFAVVAMILSSCSKYEEGPSISLKSAKARIAQEWKLVNMYNSSGEEQSIIPEWFLDFSKDGNVTTEKYGFDQPGTWAFEGDDNLKFTFGFNIAGSVVNSYENYQILRLASDELWLIDLNENNTSTYNYELRFSPK
jgi:hypothetical protein